MKRINYKRILLPAILMAMLLTSCSQNILEENAPDTSGNSGDIRFEIGFAPQTRMTTNSEFKSVWQELDVIGIFAVRHASDAKGTLDPSGGNYIQNISMGYKLKNGGTWTPAQQLWWPAGTDKLDFYAYYPYDRTITDPTQIIYNLDADQNKWNNGRPYINNQDLLIAKADNNGKGYGKGDIVSLNFSHALAMVQLSIPTSGKGAGPDEDTSVTLKGVKLKSTLNLGGENGPEVKLASEDNPAVDVKMHRVEIIGDKESYVKYTYRALVPAQTLYKNDAFFQIASGDYLYQGKGPSGELEATAGSAVTFTRTVPNKLHTIKIKAGTFMMGSPADDPNYMANEKQHKVTLTQDFRITKYNITNSQFAEFLNAKNVKGVEAGVSAGDGVHPYIYTSDIWNVHWNGSKWEPAKGRDNYPAVCVTWYGANEYALWAGGALPTEAQWEYACRAGTDTPFSFGDYDLDGDIDLDFLLKHAWCLPNSQGNPKEVGRLNPNPWGLYDMHGNVSEWCLDLYDDSYGLTSEQLANGVTDPQGAISGTKRALRSASYRSDPEDCRSAYRTSAHPNTVQFYYGFRVVFNQ